jgi:hypothetical protein
VKRCDNRLVPSAEAAMKEFLQIVVQQLVNNPNAVEVRETRGRHGFDTRTASGEGRLGPGDRQAGAYRQVAPHRP